MIYINLILTVVLGYFVYELRKVKPIHGKDGKDGLNGKDGMNGLNGKDGATGINGLKGRDGKDGLGFEPYKQGLRARNAKGEIVIEYSKPLKK
jgi:hypothetical protein